MLCNDKGDILISLVFLHSKTLNQNHTNRFVSFHAFSQSCKYGNNKKLKVRKQLVKLTRSVLLVADVSSVLMVRMLSKNINQLLDNAVTVCL